MEATNQLNLALDDYRGRHKELRHLEESIQTLASIGNVSNDKNILPNIIIIRISYIKRGGGSKLLKITKKWNNKSAPRRSRRADDAASKRSRKVRPLRINLLYYMLYPGLIFIRKEEPI